MKTATARVLTEWRECDSPSCQCSRPENDNTGLCVTCKYEAERNGLKPAEWLKKHQRSMVSEIRLQGHLDTMRRSVRRDWNAHYAAERKFNHRFNRLTIKQQMEHFGTTDPSTAWLDCGA